MNGYTKFEVIPIRPLCKNPETLKYEGLVERRICPSHVSGSMLVTSYDTFKKHTFVIYNLLITLTSANFQFRYDVIIYFYQIIEIFASQFFSKSLQHALVTTYNRSVPYLNTNLDENMAPFLHNDNFRTINEYIESVQLIAGWMTVHTHPY